MLEFLDFCEKHWLIFLRSTFENPIIFTLVKSCCETLYMVFFSSLFAMIFGLPLGVLLSVIKPSGILANPLFYRILGAIVNVVRSFPFIVLVIAATPFIARLFEGAFDEVDKGLIEATMSMGASKMRIILMMISESLPSLANAITITAVSLVGFSAMAGVVGAGGLGDLAYRIGFQSFKPDILAYAVICTIVIVQCIQSSGDLLIKRLRQHR